MPSLADVLARETRDGELYDVLPDGRLRCYACGHECPLPDGAVMTTAKSSFGGPSQFTILEADVCFSGPRSGIPTLSDAGWSVSPSFPYQEAGMRDEQRCHRRAPDRHDTATLRATPPKDPVPRPSTRA